jgi:Putative esterase
VGGSFTQLGTTFSCGPLAAGTQLRLSVVGSALSLSLNGSVYVSATDTTLASGNPAIMAYGTPYGDNWTGAATGGNPPTYSVGGTITGLSGTAVLQDNGGDNLSVSANGSFNFATQLNNAAAYNVTVYANPSGQTCTVTNPSGTVTSAIVTSVSVTCMAAPVGAVSDSFSQPDGVLGPAWTAMNDGAMVVASQMVQGSSSGYTGEIRTGEAYSSDQYSQIQVSAQLSGSQAIGVVVRAQNAGQDLYAGFYSWNFGSPELILFKRTGGSWTQVGSAYSSGPLGIGSQLRLTMVGSALSFSANDTVYVTANDASLVGGAPGIISYGTPSGDNWSGGSLAFSNVSTSSSGVQSYSITSPDDGNTAQTVRVLQPTHPTPGVAHNFLYLLPVEAGLGTTYGDGMATLAALDAEDQYNLTIIEPSFPIDPWYANNPTNATVQYETFMTTELRPWVKANFAVTGLEQHWLMGFSKSGIGGEDLILKHPDLFSVVASWDFPADMYSYSQYSASPDYGIQANFQNNYELSNSLLSSLSSPFLSNNRIWIGGYYTFQQDVSDYDALLTSLGIAHTMGPSQQLAHRWDSGWVPAALAGLYQDSLSLPAGS